MIKKICLVTTEIPRPQDPDGHRDHFSALAIALAKAGHDVSIVLADSGPKSAQEFDHWNAYYRERNVTLVRPVFDFGRIETFLDAARSFSVFRWLRSAKYDAIHFTDRSGLAYYCLLAKRQGLAFSSTELVLNVVGTLEQLKSAAGEVFSTETDLVVDFLERESRRLAPLRVASTEQERIEIAHSFPSGQTICLPSIASWVEFHSNLRTETISPVAERPFISVCLVHKDRPDFLRAALSSLVAQKYENFEVIVVDNESADQTIIEDLETNPFPFGLSVLASGQNCPNVARNLAARHAKGSHLLFMDDDNVAKPFELDEFAKAASYSDADIYTCAKTRGPDPTHEENSWTWLPIGPLLSLGIRHNVFGDTNFLVKRDVFLALGGFIEQTFYGEDWEFLSRAVFAGRKLEVVPDSLFFYREHPENLSSRLARVSEPRLRPYVKANHPGMQGLIQLTAFGPYQSDLLNPRFEHASLFMNPEQLQAQIVEVLDLESVQGPSCVTLTRAGVDPRLMMTLPGEFEGALDLEIWASAPRPQQLKVYWRKHALPDYVEENSLITTVPGELTKVSFSIPDDDRFGALRFDLEGDGSVLNLHAIRINAMSKKSERFVSRVLRAAMDHATVLKDGEIYLNGTPFDLSLIRTENCTIEKKPGRLQIVAKTDDPQLDFSYAMGMTSERFAIVVETESSPNGHFKIFWNEPYAAFSEERTSVFPLDPKGTRHAVMVASNRGISGLRLDPMDTTGTILIRKISICTEAFLTSSTIEAKR